MKKIRLIIIIILFTGLSAAVAAAGDPYSFMPSRAYRMDDSIFYRSEKLVEITPHRPLLIKDTQGNMMFTSSDGKVMVQVDNSGNKTFFLDGDKQHVKNPAGEIEKRWIREEGSKLVKIENERSEVIGYEEYAMGGKLVASYDEDKNLVRMLEYDETGQHLVESTDMLTLTRTVYDNLGNPVKDVDFEGYEVAWYEHDMHGRLLTREDKDGYITHYNEDGNMEKTYSRDGILVKTYDYSVDERGHKVLKSVTDRENQTVTIYENDRQVKTVDDSGNLVRSYKWVGTRLIYTEENDSTITWYRNAKPAYTTYKGEIQHKWYYEEGHLVARWDQGGNKLDFYLYGRPVSFLETSMPPPHSSVVDLREQAISSR